MSVAKHTPGPWLTKPPRIGASITIYGGPDEVFPVATTCSNTSPATMQAHRDGTVAANALLIVAAPDLLAAAKRALNVLKAMGETPNPKNALGALEAAISKATGQQGDAA